MAMELETSNNPLRGGGGGGSTSTSTSTSTSGGGNSSNPDIPADVKASAGSSEANRVASSGVLGSVIEALDSEQVQTIISAGIDAVLATGESLPVIEHLAALLIKFKSKAEELAANGKCQSHRSQVIGGI